MAISRMSKQRITNLFLEMAHLFGEKGFWKGSKYSCICFIQKQPFIGVLTKKVFWKYAANLQENTHAAV